MSAKDIAEYSAQICVGAMAIVSGGSAIVAVPAVAGLAAIGYAFRQRRLAESHAACLAATVDALEASPEHLPHLNHARAILAADPPDQPPRLTHADIVVLRDVDRGRFADNVAAPLLVPYDLRHEPGPAEVIRLAFATTTRAYLRQAAFREAINDGQS